MNFRYNKEKKGFSLIELIIVVVIIMIVVSFIMNFGFDPSVVTKDDLKNHPKASYKIVVWEDDDDEDYFEYKIYFVVNYKILNVNGKLQTVEMKLDNNQSITTSGERIIYSVMSKLNR